MESEANILANALDTWQAVKRGEKKVISDSSLDALAIHFGDQDTLEASVYFRCSRTVPNPTRVGILDAYIMSLTDGGLSMLAGAQAAMVA